MKILFPSRWPLALFVAFFAICASALIAPETARAYPPDLDLPRGFVQEAIVNGLEMPVTFAFAPDGRIFINEKGGTVRVLHNGVLQPRPFLDISHKVNTVKDRGLIGVAVHPRWPAMPYIYLSYTYDPPEVQGRNPEGARVSRVVRVTADPANLNLALPGSELVLVGGNSTFAHIGNPDEMNRRPYTCKNPDGSYVQDCMPNEGNSHTASHLAFGPDGALYIAVGDGINYDYGNLRAQSLDSLAGKILRVDPMTGAGLSSNPFFDGNPASNRSKIFALGVRNPFRFVFQPGTGALIVSDVGLNKWEEFNRVPPGANLGWPCFEGPQENAFDPECRPTLSGEWPVTHAFFAYKHENSRGAAIAGDFVQGGNFPALYGGALFYTDYNSATIDYLLFDSNGSAISHVFAAPAFAAAQMAFASDGTLYVLYVLNGSLARIRYVGADNAAPVAVGQATPLRDEPPLEVQFSAANSYDPDGDRLSFQWDFGDGNSSSVQDPRHIYAQPGYYQAELTVRDWSAAHSTRVDVIVGQGPPRVEILEPAHNSRFWVGQRVRFRGRAVDNEDGELPGSALRWEVLLHHNQHVHGDVFSASGNSGSLIFEDHADNIFLELCLSATDSAGIASRTCADLHPLKVVVGFTSQPAGVPVSFGGSTYETPFRVRTNVNAVRSIEVPPSQGRLQFGGWSDGGARRHSARFLASETFVVTYADPSGAIPSTGPPDPSSSRIVNDAATTRPAQVAPPPPAVAVSARVERTVQPVGNPTPVKVESAPPDGARILLRTGEHRNGQWSVVQWRNPQGVWENVEGWTGAIEFGRKRWWIHPDAYGSGPFRWLLYAQEGGGLLAASAEFNLPENKDQMIVWEVE